MDDSWWNYWIIFLTNLRTNTAGAHRRRRVGIHKDFLIECSIRILDESDRNIFWIFWRSMDIYWTVFLVHTVRSLARIYESCITVGTPGEISTKIPSLFLEIKFAAISSNFLDECLYESRSNLRRNAWRNFWSNPKKLRNFILELHIEFLETSTGIIQL